MKAVTRQNLHHLWWIVSPTLWFVMCLVFAIGAVARLLAPHTSWPGVLLDVFLASMFFRMAVFRLFRLWVMAYNKARLCTCLEAEDGKPALRDPHCAVHAHA